MLNITFISSERTITTHCFPRAMSINLSTFILFHLLHLSLNTYKNPGPYKLIKIWYIIQKLFIWPSHIQLYKENGGKCFKDIWLSPNSKDYTKCFSSKILKLRIEKNLQALKIIVDIHVVLYIHKVLLFLLHHLEI